MNDDEVVISLTGISKKYKLFKNKEDRMKEALHPFKKRYHKEFFALNGIDLKVRKGEILGIVGMNGSGKSTLLKIIAGIIPPTTGEIAVSGNVVPLLELGAGFNPEYSGLENIYFYNSILGYSRKQTDAILDKILDFAEIGDFIHQPLKTYSSGMRARLSFAVSVNINPDILIVDEILSVGDELFRRKSFSKIEEFFQAKKTILFVSHSAGNVNQLCSRALMLDKGKIVLQGTPKFVTMNYLKFIFSNPQERKTLLEEFHTAQEPDQTEQKKIEDSLQNDQQIEFTTPEPAKSGEQPFLIPNFIAKSTILTSNADIKVHDMKIETLDGKPVNALVRNKEYFFSYVVTFNEDLNGINYSLAFKTEKGFPVSWRIFPGKDKYLETAVTKGEVVKVKWKFNCRFMPGNYFINIGIRSSHDMNEILLFQGADIHVFKVIGGAQKDLGGVFDAGISLSLSNNV
jgi:lipopolysaccharide transport system ATP-binding protein